MPFSIVEGDITKLKVDAIVNAANKSLLGGGGVDGAIHRAAGPKLLEECRTLNGCETGQAKITGGYDLAAKYVIHTVGPIWTGGRRGEPELLCAAYRNSLNLAKENNCESVAFPLISSGVYGYPKDQALKMAVRTIREFLEDNEMNVILVIFDKSSFRPDMLFMSEISEYIRNNMEQPSKKAGLLGDMARSIAFGGASGSRRSIFSCKKRSGPEKENSVPSEDACEEPKEARPEDVEAEQQDALYSTSADAAAYGAQLRNAVPDMSLESDLKKALDNLDESFSQALLRMIDARGMKDSECYKKANIDRKLFSKIRSDVNYRPSKQTVLAFAIALELDLYEAEAFLRKAGYALSRSNKADVIVEYFITNKNYDMYRINEALFAFDQNLLGA